MQAGHKLPWTRANRYCPAATRGPRELGTHRDDPGRDAALAAAEGARILGVLTDPVAPATKLTEALTSYQAPHLDEKDRYAVEQALRCGDDTTVRLVATGVATGLPTGSSTATPAGAGVPTGEARGTADAHRPRRPDEPQAVDALFDDLRSHAYASAR